MTEHVAAVPHVPGQGSVHLLLLQARSRGQSALIRHSGLQPVSPEPRRPGGQLQEQPPVLEAEARAPGPQGSG